MKKYLRLIIPGLMAVSLSACGLVDDILSSGDSQTDAAQTISIEDAGQDDTSNESKQTTEDAGETAESVSTETQNTSETQPADALTLEQKVGQLFIVRPDALDPSQEAAQIDDANSAGVTELTETMKESLAQYPVGGVCQFSKNIVSPEQILQFNEDLQSVSEIPMFITVDEEGGIVARLANNDAFDLPKYQSAASVGASGNSSDAYDMGQTIGAYLKEYGFNMDFAPDADVNTNPNNPIIGTRAFSSDAQIAADMVSAAAEGFREEGILPTLKHFPGHGDTSEDSHTSLAVTYKSLEELQSCEFLPFEADTGLHAVMVGHIAAPNVTGTDTPASLCAELVSMIPDMENTLIVTDSLSMQAITDAHPSGEAAVLAFQAGCDVLLMPVDLGAAYNAILEAVKDGTISEERLNQSVNKILYYKQQFYY